MSLPLSDSSRYRGALLGLAVGDALGVPAEFKRLGTFEPVTDLIGGGWLSLPAGAWTDDTSMALCLADSLVTCGRFVPEDQLQRYLLWLDDGYFSSTGGFVDVGDQTRDALERFRRTGEPFPGDHFPTEAGNAPLMRLAPVPMAYRADPDLAAKRAAESCRTTHGGQQAIDASRFFSALMVDALNGGPTLERVRSNLGEDLPGFDGPVHEEVAAVIRGSYLYKEPPEIQGDGYVVKALEAALWALSRNNDFESGVLAAVNLGDDADTTAAIFGQLAGAIWGVDAIPERWLEKLVMRDEITAMADALYETAEAGTFIEGWPADPERDLGEPRKHEDQEIKIEFKDGPPPLPGDSFWFQHGLILAGPYPGAIDLKTARNKLDAFLDVGITCFVDLTEEGEPGQDDSPIKPYSALLEKISAKRGIETSYMRFPIRDVSIPTVLQMKMILAAIEIAVADHEGIYIHCRGGVGRTGTVLGCLGIHRGVPHSEILERIQQMRSGTKRRKLRAPETEHQREFIGQWRVADPPGDIGSFIEEVSYEEEEGFMGWAYPKFVKTKAQRHRWQLSLGNAQKMVDPAGRIDMTIYEMAKSIYWSDVPTE